MRYIKIIVIQVLAVLSVRLFDMGMAWTQGELGFHPMAAGAVAHTYGARMNSTDTAPAAMG